MRWTLFIAAKDSSPPKNPAMPDESRSNRCLLMCGWSIGNRIEAIFVVSQREERKRYDYKGTSQIVVADI